MSDNLVLDLGLFDEPTRPGPGPVTGDAPARIGEACQKAGIHVPSTLYNEGLVLARDGHLGPAQQRLQMLVCLDPDDGDALLLLARVHAAQERWSDALSRLDAATAAGALAPAGLRDAFEAAIRAERSREEEHRARVAAREIGEMRALRHEAKTLRSVAVRLEGEVSETRERERSWKLAALASGVFGTVVIALLLVVGVDDAPPAPVVVDASPPIVVGSLPDIVIEPAAPGDLAPANVGAPEELVPPPDAVQVASGPRTHVVKKNETLYRLAARYYGDKSDWKRIAEANPQTGPDGTRLSLGMELVIPH
ncbi:MAG: LysM peptidoglycan-binding domain-containing protein [Deltaproteobacteria bacterium]|nr:LysM peptidoglycan-binding domain-containing protein [Deltaproteobacteria bacterium]